MGSDATLASLPRLAQTERLHRSSPNDRGRLARYRRSPACAAETPVELAPGLLFWTESSALSRQSTPFATTGPQQGREWLSAKPVWPWAIRTRVQSEVQGIGLMREGTTEKPSFPLPPLELFGRRAPLIPPPRRHRHRCYGIRAPDAPLRAQINALAGVPKSSTAPLVTATETETAPIAAQITAAGASCARSSRTWASRHHRRLSYRPGVHGCARWPMPSRARPTRKANRHRATNSSSASPDQGRTRTFRINVGKDCLHAGTRR